MELVGRAVFTGLAAVNVMIAGGMPTFGAGFTFQRHCNVVQQAAADTNPVTGRVGLHYGCI